MDEIALDIWYTAVINHSMPEHVHLQMSLTKTHRLVTYITTVHCVLTVCKMSNLTCTLHALAYSFSFC